MIHISNNLYLVSSGAQALRGNPIIGYQSILEIDNVSADSSPDETPVVNLVNEQTNQFWESGSTAEQYIYFTNSLNSPIDYIGIARHNFGSGLIEYQLQVSDGQSPEIWSDITISRMPENDSAIIHFFDEADDSLFRLRLVPNGTEPKIAHIKLGQALILPQQIYVGHSPITLNRRTDVITNTSENGQFLGRIQKRQSLETVVEMAHIEPDFYRDSVDPFVEHAVTGAFFFAWRPLQYPKEVGFGWTSGDISPSNQMPNGMMQFSFNMKAVA
jgi:hypothetical protein